MRPKKLDKEVSVQVYLTPSMKIRITRFAELYNVSTSALMKMWITRQLAYEAKLFTKEQLKREAAEAEKLVDEATKEYNQWWEAHYK